MKFANPSDFQVFRDDPDYTLVDIPPLTGVYVGISNYFAPLDDVRVRHGNFDVHQPRAHR